MDATGTKRIALKKRRGYRISGIRSYDWKESLPFSFTEMGRLVHRVRTAATIYRGGERYYDSIQYWCGNFGDGSVHAEPPAGRIVCSRCEQAAIASGLQPSSVLCGREVAVGGFRAEENTREEAVRFKAKKF